MSCGRFEIKRYFPQTNLLIAQWGELSLFSIKCRKTVIVTLSCAVLFGDQKIRRETADFLSMANSINDDNRHTFVRNTI